MFSYGDYTELMNKLRSRGYHFASFPDTQALLAEGRPFVLLRHDIDFDLESALRMAHIEAEMDIAATYFFLVRTDHYNVFSAYGTAIVQQILNLGHHLGLHFDCAAYPELNVKDLPLHLSQSTQPDEESRSAQLTAKRLSQVCRLETQMLEDWFHDRVSIVSYHRPSPYVLTGDPVISAPLPHTYMMVFREQVHYISESRGEWRYGHPTDSEAFRQGRPLHLLIHPVWWRDEPTLPYETLVRYLRRRQRFLERSVAHHCSVFRPIDDEQEPLR